MRTVAWYALRLLCGLSVVAFVYLGVMLLRSVGTDASCTYRYRAVAGPVVSKHQYELHSASGRLTLDKTVWELTFPSPVDSARLQPPTFKPFEKRSVELPPNSWRQGSLLRSIGFRLDRITTSTGRARVLAGPGPPSRQEAKELGIPFVGVPIATVPLTHRHTSVGIPTALPMLLCALLPGWAIARLFRWSRRARRGECPACGYDLRASTGPCPECGEPREGQTLRGGLAQIVLVTLCTTLLASCAASPPGTPPEKRSLAERLGLPTIALREVTGTPAYPPLAADPPVATVLLFLAPDCPVSNAYAPEIGRLIDDYWPRGVGFIAVYADPRLSDDEVRRHANAFNLRCPVMVDPRQELARAVGATVTPEAAVFDAEGERVYVGRIDDLYFDFGRRRAAPTTRDLRDALDAVLAGKPVAWVHSPAIGCEIPPP